MRGRIWGMALALFAGAAAPAAAQGGGIYGDVSGDGKVMAADALAILAHTVGRALPVGYTIDPNGDVNGDGKIMASDALIVLSFTVGRDVSQYRVGKPISSAGTASLTIIISGLPGGAPAAVLLNGPNSFQRSITSSVQITGLAAGAYQAAVDPVGAAGAVFDGKEQRVAFSLAAGESKTLPLTYSRAELRLTPAEAAPLQIVAISGLPDIRRLDGISISVGGKPAILERDSAGGVYRFMVPIGLSSGIVSVRIPDVAGGVAMISPLRSLPPAYPGGTATNALTELKHLGQSMASSAQAASLPAGAPASAAFAQQADELNKLVAQFDASLSGAPPEQREVMASYFALRKSTVRRLFARLDSLSRSTPAPDRLADGTLASLVQADPISQCEAFVRHLDDAELYSDVADEINVALTTVKFAGPTGKAVGEFLSLFTQAMSLYNLGMQAIPVLLDSKGLMIHIAPPRVSDDGGTAGIQARVQRRAAGEALGEGPGVVAGGARDRLVEWAKARAEAKTKYGELDVKSLSAILLAAGVSEVAISKMKEGLSGAGKDWFGGGIGSLTLPVPLLLRDVLFSNVTVWTFVDGRAPQAYSGKIQTLTASVEAGAHIVPIPIDALARTSRTSQGRCEAATDSEKRAPEKGRNGFELAIGRLELTPAKLEGAAGTNSKLGTQLLDGSGQTIGKDGWTWSWSSSNASVADFGTGTSNVDTDYAVVRLRSAGQARITAIATKGNTSRQGYADVTVTPRISVAKVEVSPSTATLNEGKTVQLQAKVTATDGSDVTGKALVEWSSSSGSVATVTAQGLVSAIAAGKATITASVGDKSATAAITVIRVPSEVASVSVTPSSASIRVGETQQFSASATDASGKLLSGKTFSWNSSSPGVAAVDASGLVKGVAAGPATITATVTGGGKSGSATISVAAAPPPPPPPGGGTFYTATINPSLFTMPRGKYCSRSLATWSPRTKLYPVGTKPDDQPPPIPSPINVRLALCQQDVDGTVSRRLYLQFHNNAHVAYEASYRAFDNPMQTCTDRPRDGNQLIAAFGRFIAYPGRDKNDSAGAGLGTSSVQVCMYNFEIKH